MNLCRGVEAADESVERSRGQVILADLNSNGVGDWCRRERRYRRHLSQLEVLPNLLERDVDLKQNNKSFWQCVHGKLHFIENYTKFTRLTLRLSRSGAYQASTCIILVCG